MEVFSIIIPVYNRPEEIDDLLNSLTRQTYVHFEVIVVDDGSSIPCEPIVNAYNNRLRIRYFYIENSGPGLARNQGVRYAEGEIVIVLDSDFLRAVSIMGDMLRFEPLHIHTSQTGEGAENEELPCSLELFVNDGRLQYSLQLLRSEITPCAVWQFCLVVRKRIDTDILLLLTYADEFSKEDGRYLNSGKRKVAL